MVICQLSQASRDVINLGFRPHSLSLVRKPASVRFQHTQASIVAHRLQTDPKFLRHLSKHLPRNVRTSLALFLVSQSDHACRSAVQSMEKHHHHPPRPIVPRHKPLVNYSLDQNVAAIQKPSLPHQGATRLQFVYLFVRTMIPYLGFGMASNTALVLAGDLIDSTVCLFFGFSTLAAAGMGNAISDTVGMLSTEPIQRLSDKIGIPRPEVSEDQASTASTVSLVAKVVGMILGCLLGLLPLLFIEDAPAHMVDLVTICLTPEQRMAVIRSMVKCHYTKGEKIIERGSEPTWLHLMIEGKVEAIGRDHQGNPVLMCVYEEGDVFGELEMIYPQPCRGDIIAVTDHVETRRIHKSDFQKHMGPAVGVFMHRIATQQAKEDRVTTLQKLQRRDRPHETPFN